MPVSIDSLQALYDDEIKQLQKATAQDIRRRCARRLYAVDYVLSTQPCVFDDEVLQRAAIRQALYMAYHELPPDDNQINERDFNTFLIKQLHKANLTEGCLNAGDAEALLSHYYALSHALDDIAVKNNWPEPPSINTLKQVVPDACDDEINAHTMRSVAAQKADACFAKPLEKCNKHNWAWLWDVLVKAPVFFDNQKNKVSDVRFLKDIGAIQAREYAEAHRVFKLACHNAESRYGSIFWALQENGKELIKAFPDPDKLVSAAVAPDRSKKSSIRYWLGTYLPFFQEEEYPTVTDLTRLTYVLRYAKEALVADNQDKRMPAMKRMDALRQTLPGYEKVKVKLTAYIGLLALAVVLGILLAIPSGGTSMLLMGVGVIELSFKMSLATCAWVLFDTARISWNLWRETDERGLARALGLFKGQLDTHAPDMDKEMDAEIASGSEPSNTSPLLGHKQKRD